MILTDNKSIARHISGTTLVSMTELQGYVKNGEVVGAICSRALAMTLQEMKLPNLRFIQLLSAGVDGIVPSECAKRGITLCNAAGVYSVGMAEFVIYAMLMSAKRYNRHISNGHIRLQRGYRYMTELAGKTLGVMGVGGIGTEVAKRAAAFDMVILGYAEHTREKAPFKRIYHKDGIKEFAAQCDYIVSTLPDTEGTQGLINASFMEATKEKATFVNVGRMATINDADMISHLHSHPDKTAILDMFECLPNPLTNPYRRLKNVKVLPGVTAISQEIDAKLLALVKENVRRFNSGEELLNVVRQ